jgi:ribosomal protein L16 Arg81 hydroxylase
LSDLKYLLSPITENRFFEKYWEKQPVLIKRNNPAYFQDILSLEIIDEYLATKGLRFPEIKVIKNGEWLISNTKGILKRYSLGTKFIDITNLLDYYSDGATIIFLALDRHLPSISELCRGLQKILNIHIQANVYLTPRTSKGFNAHFDTHDVFILQVEGKKHWKIWNNKLKFPLKHQEQIFGKDQEKKIPDIDIVLEKGDTLYIPRGFIHSGSSLRDNSMHITVGIVPFIFVNMLSQKINNILSNLAEDELLQRIIPPQFALENDLVNSTTINDFNLLREKILNQIDFEQTKQEAYRIFLERRLPNCNGLVSSISKLKNINEGTVLFKRKDVNFLLLKDTETKLIVNGNSMTFPLHFFDILSKLIDKDNFRIGDILNEISLEGKLFITQKLLRSGLYSLNKI